MFLFISFCFIVTWEINDKENITKINWCLPCFFLLVIVYDYFIFLHVNVQLIVAVFLCYLFFWIFSYYFIGNMSTSVAAWHAFFFFFCFITFIIFIIFFIFFYFLSHLLFYFLHVDMFMNRLLLLRFFFRINFCFFLFFLLLHWKLMNGKIISKWFLVFCHALFSSYNYNLSLFYFCMTH